MKLKSLFIILPLMILVVYYVYPEDRIPAGTQISKLVVYKSKRQLIAYANGKKVCTYTIALGRQPRGAKEFEGDRKTPEGLYYIHDKNPYSGYHKNLGISYPNKADIRRASLKGKPAGGLIKIHGLRNGLGFVSKFHRFFDWTLGCIALTDEELDDLYAAVKIGTPIEIFP
jgi:murein L,D-transpeptidase YafK